MLAEKQDSIEYSPMCYGQLAQWKSRTLKVPQLHLGDLWVLPNGVTQFDVEKALTALMVRHEALRTCYSDKSGLPEQRILGAAKPPVSVIDIDTDDFTADPFQSLPPDLLSLRCHCFDLDNELSWLAAIVTVKKVPRYLFFVRDHIMADFYALSQLRSEFATVIRGGTVSKTPALQPRQLALMERSQAQRDRHCPTLDYFRGVYNAMALSRRQSHEVESASKWTNSGGILRTNVAMAQLRYIASQVGTAPSAVLIAMMTTKVAHLLKTEAVPIVLSSSNRFTKSVQSLVCSISQAVPMLANIPSDTRFSTLAQRIQSDVTIACRYSSYDPMQVDELNREMKESRTGSSNVCIIFNIMLAPVTNTPTVHPNASACRLRDDFRELPTIPITAGPRSVNQFGLWAEPGRYIDLKINAVSVFGSDIARSIALSIRRDIDVITHNPNISVRLLSSVV